MKERKIRVWVDPEFHRMMKIEAAKRDKSIIDFSKELVENDEPMIFFKKDKKDNRRNNGFYF